MVEFHLQVGFCLQVIEHLQTRTRSGSLLDFAYGPSAQPYLTEEYLSWLEIF